MVVPDDRVVNSVNVREAPTTATIGQLRRGEQALLLLDVPSWYKIRLPNAAEGFVSKAWTHRVAAPPPIAGDIPFTIHFLDVGTGDSAIVDLGDREITDARHSSDGRSPSE